MHKPPPVPVPSCSTLGTARTSSRQTGIPHDRNKSRTTERHKTRQKPIYLNSPSRHPYHQYPCCATCHEKSKKPEKQQTLRTCKFSLQRQNNATTKQTREAGRLVDSMCVRSETVAKASGWSLSSAVWRLMLGMHGLCLVGPGTAPQRGSRSAV